MSPTSRPTIVVTANAMQKQRRVERDVGRAAANPADRAASALARTRRATNSPASAAERGQHQRFGQQLADQARPAGAERRPHGKLGAPLRVARQQQVDHVDARNQQQQPDGGDARRASPAAPPASDRRAAAPPAGRCGIDAQGAPREPRDRIARNLRQLRRGIPARHAVAQVARPSAGDVPIRGPGTTAASGRTAATATRRWPASTGARRLAGITPITS